MNSSTPPVIAFELGVGEFRIVTPEAVYQIKVCHDLVEATRVDEDKSGPASPGGQNAEEAQPESFFQEISEELFDKIGRLARKLSVSVEELPEQLDAPDLDETDQQLENAKGQLEEVVKLTEKASMTIMDTADLIQTDMDELRGQLDILQNLDLMAAQPPESGLSASDTPTPQVNICDKPPIDPAFFDKLGELRIFIETLLNQAETEPPSAAEPVMTPPAPTAAEPEPEAVPPQAAVQTIMVTRFDVDVVFQTLYELCTNESVKDHIKAMREAQQTAFNTTAVADHLSELAPTVDEEDGFFNFPITAVLKSLYGATASEEYRLILKKMNQTAASIFLDSVLPIEGETTEVEIPAEAAPAPEAPPAEPVVETTPEPETDSPIEENAQVCSLDDLKTIKNLATEIEQLGSALAAPAPGNETVQVVEGGPLYTSILTKDRDTIVATVTMAHTLIRQTGAHLTRILETLSFQDLSGQRIMKVVSLIGEVQMQLLSILISVNTKLKVHQETGTIEANSATAEKMAQDEVDRALEKLSGGPSSLLGPGAEARLDQGAVNDLLAQLGF